MIKDLIDFEKNKTTMNFLIGYFLFPDIIPIISKKGLGNMLPKKIIIEPFFFIFL